MSAGAEFIAASRRYLARTYPSRIRASVERLTPEQLWWRPNEASNSVGNLLLHMAGNVGQWIVSGVGGAPDTRERQAEFDAREGGTAAELLARLDGVVAAADSVLAGLDEARLADRLTIQDHDVSVLEAIYHVVEHFSGHTAQIVYATKMATGEDLGLYRSPGSGSGGGPRGAP